MADELPSLVAELKKLVEKLDAPKKTDWSQKIAVLTPFLSSVLLAGLSLWLTWSNQQGQITLAREAAAQQKAFQDAQVRVAELEAISKLMPSLSSKDPVERQRAEELLRAVQKSGPIAADELQPKPSADHSGNRSEPNTSRASVLDNFAAILVSGGASEASRVQAAASIAQAVKTPGTPLSDRRRAVEVLAKVADSPTTPPAVRNAAQFAIADIRQVDVSQIAAIVKNEPNTRKIDEVILHHAALKISDYKGFPTIAMIANFEMGVMKWDRVGFHYAVAPDGTIWIGMPLNQIAYHAANKNPTTVGVMLIMDGNSELPTVAQQKALVELLNALFAKLGIKAVDNFAKEHGFHSDYNKFKSCPGKLMTKEKVLSWLGVPTVTAGTSH